MVVFLLSGIIDVFILDISLTTPPLATPNMGLDASVWYFSHVDDRAGRPVEHPFFSLFFVAKLLRRPPARLPLSLAFFSD